MRDAEVNVAYRWFLGYSVLRIKEQNARLRIVRILSLPFLSCTVLFGGAFSDQAFPLSLLNDAAFNYKAVRIHGVAVNILERHIEIGMEEAFLGQTEVKNVR